MARHQTIFDWGIEVLDLLVFIAGVATAAVAAVGVFSSGRVAIIFLGGMPTVFCLAVCFRLCSTTLLKKRLSPRAHVDGDEEGGGMLQGVAGHGPPRTAAAHVAVACQSGRRLLQVSK
ncbi:unnamed protein product [Urochloa humidicola]